MFNSIKKELAKEAINFVKQTMSNGSSHGSLNGGSGQSNTSQSQSNPNPHGQSYDQFGANPHQTPGHQAALSGNAHQSSQGGINAYSQPTTLMPTPEAYIGQGNGYSQQSGYPNGQNGYPSGQNGNPTGQNEYPNSQPGYANTQSEYSNSQTVSYSQNHGRGEGKHRALLIGINYFSQQGELRGCINDVNNVQEWLSRYYPKFTPAHNGELLILTDNSPDPARVPTKANIISAMRWLVAHAQPGDSFFLHYSGHGGTQKDLDGDEADGQDETICPVDFKHAGVITDDEMHLLLLKNLPQGCKFTALFDSCHSGSVLDLPFTYTVDGNLHIHEIDNRKAAAKHAISAAMAYAAGNEKQAISQLTSAAKVLFSGSDGHNAEAAKKQKATRSTLATVTMFSGCNDNQTSADAHIAGKHTGAMSWALRTVMDKHQGQVVSYVQVLRELREQLQGKFSQVPQMSTGFQTDMNQPFLLYA